jgi:hypothetical protein
MAEEHPSPLPKTVGQEAAAATGQALRDVYRVTAEQALPFRFGKALGAVFAATTELKEFGASRSK